jgi:hypothetical protein
MSITGVAPPVDEILLTVPETLVTVPLDAGAAQTGTPPVSVKTLVFDPTASLLSVFAALAYRRSPVAYVAIPVPPFVGPIEVAFQTPVATVPRVVIEVWPTYVAAISITGSVPPDEVILSAVPRTLVTEPPPPEAPVLSKLFVKGLNTNGIVISELWY